MNGAEQPRETCCFTQLTTIRTDIIVPCVTRKVALHISDFVLHCCRYIWFARYGCELEWDYRLCGTLRNWERRWCSGLSACLAPTSPGFNSVYGLYMYVQVVFLIHMLLCLMWMLQSKC